LIVAVLLAPYLIDVEAYKASLIRAVKEATGRELVIDGPMKLSLWPEPRVSAQRVRFANAPGTQGAQMLDVRWVGVSPSWLALLTGRVAVGRLTLYQPTIILETDADGVPNWRFQPGAGAVQPEGDPAAGFHLAIGTLRVVQGTVSYTNPKTRRTFKAEQVQATASVRSFDGPFSIAGQATVNGVPLSLDLSVSEAKSDGHDAVFYLKVANGTLGFKGVASAIKPDAAIKGHLSVTSGLLTDFIANVVQATGQPQPRFEGSITDVFTFEGGIEYSPTRIALTDFKMSLGGETASGSVALEAGKTPSITGRVVLPKVDVETWLALLATPSAFLPAAPAPKPGSLSPFPPEMEVSLSLDVAEVLYRKGTLRDVAVALEIHKGVITVPRLKAVLPGDLVLQAKALATGELSLAGPNLRDSLAWLGVDTSRVPEGRLQGIELRSKLASTANGVQLSDLVINLDDQHATGSGSATFGTPLTLSASLHFDRLDLDPYLPLDARPAVASSTPNPMAAPTPSAPTAAAPVFGLKVKAAEVVLRKETLTGVEGDLSLQGNLLKLNSVRIASLLGARLDAKGSLVDFATAPRFDLAFNAAMPDADKVLAYVGLPKFANGKIGAVTASAGLAGTVDALAVRNASVSLLGSTARATGTLALGQNFRFDLSSFDLQTPDASRLLAVATGRTHAGIGAITAEGAFKGDAGRAGFDGDITALGTPMKGHIDATLGQRPSITANLRVPGTLDLDQWLGVSNTPPAAGPAATTVPPGAAPPASPPIAVVPRAASGKPIDLAALRAFDATLTLETSAVEVASLTVLYADLQASLKNGLLKIGKLTGQFYGGAVDFAGTIDATQQALALHLEGSLQGIHLGEMLRGAAGTNNFGNEHLKVAIDGKISVMDIDLRGSGSTPQQIRDSLSGRGHLTGYLYPSVSAGSLGLASFATAIGSVFSTEMGFGSAVLSSFIEHKSDIAGEVLLSGNTLALRNQKVQGQNAIALVNSRNSLTSATTDTEIALDTGRQGPADYVMTVKGPLASPTMTTRAGPH
jgi:uncharacterized protein involved in outer membrane biogenesis